MEKNEIMNTEVMENANEVIYDVAPVAHNNAKNILVKSGVAIAVAAGCYGAYIGTKKLISIVKAQKAAKDDKAETEEKTEE